MNRYLVSFLILTATLFAETATLNEEKTIEDNVVLTEPYNPNVDCLILEDENSIICKFEVIRDPINEQLITINWISPTGEISRSREMIIPAGDSSAYDYRYIDGRENGKWDFRIIYNGKEYSSQFELK
ncbi:MAG: hypothetical protein AB7S49_07460 [Arcobacter sp.]|jgi:hypothetical protein|uniref:DUF3859 domain-containing protein n=1 Tax=Arcobacter defluvii TaxID=873191 RepID=A0AAE7BI93_9BACT|nr:MULTISPECIES: hypothetical protein [Arcobacter]MDY3201368.1 hypothetical protein [Arcobacter sp.]QKF78347.1 hypothetical protein ADFLV_2342 [Arcobacter defluvii]RXI30203.1 hypothetical protein CP964_12255 [Arcobacter defluvii]BAK74144.1 conserved hypothetical protein [Arcobacter sp. L]